MWASRSATRPDGSRRSRKRTPLISPPDRPRTKRHRSFIQGRVRSSANDNDDCDDSSTSSDTGTPRQRRPTKTHSAAKAPLPALNSDFYEIQHPRRPQRPRDPYLRFDGRHRPGLGPERRAHVHHPDLRRHGLQRQSRRLQQERPCLSSRATSPASPTPKSEHVIQRRSSTMTIWTALDEAVAARRDHCVALFRPHHERDPVSAAPLTPSVA